MAPWLKENWPLIREKLLTGQYKPWPVRRVEIPKPGGGMRQLGIPSVLDRLIQQALLEKLTPMFDPTFSEHSHGFRPGRSAHDAVIVAQHYVKEGLVWVVDMDLEKFFDRVTHDKLMARVARRVKDGRVLRLIRRHLRKMYWRLWKKWRTRAGNLQKLGLPCETTAYPIVPGMKYGSQNT